MRLISAHRGGAEGVAGGSWAAYRQAVEAGADLVEVDVRRDAAGQWVCAHDRCEPSSPRLAAVLELCAQHGVGAHVDVKESGAERELVSFVGAYQLPHVLFTTGDTAAVRRLRALGAPALLTVGPSLAGRSWAERARAVGQALLPYRRIRACGAAGVAAQFRFGWWGLRWWCTRRGLPVLVWTVNSEVALRYWLHAPWVSVVVTDRPARALALAGRARR